MTSARLGEEDDGVDAVVVLTGWGRRVSGWERGVGCGDDAGPLLGCAREREERERWAAAGVAFGPVWPWPLSIFFVLSLFCFFEIIHIF